MPHIAYLILSILLIIQLAVAWMANKQNEPEITAILLMSIGATLTIIVLGKCGVEIK